MKQESNAYKHFKTLESHFIGLKPKIIDLIAIAKSEFMDCPLNGQIFGLVLYIDQYGGVHENWSNFLIPLYEELNAKIKDRKPLYPEKFNKYKENLSNLNNIEFIGCVRSFAVDIRVEYPRLLEIHQKLNLALNEGNG